jgi:hypothetical protein
MEATIKHVETPAATTTVKQDEQQGQALQELSSFELSLVGGGLGAVSFM